MNNKNGKISFLEYINSPMSKESIVVLYSANNIQYEKCELYNDFVQSLLMLAFDTYMGDDVTTQEGRLKHFKWCWEQNIKNFEKENIKFNDTLDLYDYFLTFLFEVYYIIPNKKQNLKLTENISKMWLNLFDMNILKAKSDIDSFLELYHLFEVSLLKK